MVQPGLNVNYTVGGDGAGEVHVKLNLPTLMRPGGISLLACFSVLLIACGKGEMYSACMDQERMTAEACTCLQDEADAVLDDEGKRFITALMWGDSEARENNPFEELPLESMDGVSAFIPAIGKCGVGIETNYLGF